MNRRRTDELPLGMNPDDLPAWMQAARREIDWAMWAAAALCLITMWPLLARSGLPRNTETQALIYRTVEMAEGLQDGIIYPRWAPDFNYGYGSPVFNYLPPMPHYLAGLVRVLFQISVENSVKSIFALGAGLNGLAFFAFVRRRWGATPAILALAIYLFNPQSLLVKPYLQADLSGLMALGWFWMTLWALDRMLASEGRWSGGLVAGSVACLWLTHGRLSIVLTGVALGWVAVRLAGPGGSTRSHAWRVVLAAAAGIGGAAFFWLPAWAEGGAVHWVPFPGYSDELAASLPLRELLSQPGRLDLSAINPTPSAALGIAVWLPAVMAAVWIATAGWKSVSPAMTPMSRGDALQRRIAHLTRWIAREHAEAAYFGAIGLVSVLLITPWASSVWESGREWPRFGPRDLLWIVMGSGAVLGAQSAVLAERLNRRGMTLMAAHLVVGLVALTALPVMYPPKWPTRHVQPTREEIVREELRGIDVAGLTGGWLLPRGVDALPAPSPTLLASYQGGAVDKIARDALPAATQIDIVEHAPQQERLVVQTRVPVDVTIQTFNFPGWKAYLNNQEVPIRTNSSTGLMAIHVLEGRYDAKIALGSTPARTAGWLIALASVAGAVAVVLVRSGGREVMEQRSVTRPQERSLAATREGRLILLSAVLWLGVCSALPPLWPEAFTARSAPGTVSSAGSPLPRALQGGIDLLAFDVAGASEVTPGSQLSLTLYWRAIRPDLPDYQVNVAVSPAGEPEKVIGLVRHRHPAMIPSSTWPVWPLLDHHVRDVYSISIAPDAPAGEYEIHVQVGRCSQLGAAPCDSLIPLFVRDGRGSSLGQSITLPERVAVRP